jgi:glycosyltransferase involved in cell wall biosynthesis
MKILQVCDVHDGDMARHVADIAFGLGKRGHGVDTIPVTPTGNADSDEDAPSADRHPFGALVHHLRRHGPFDLIHAHGSSAGTVARAAALFSTAGVIYTPHTFALSGATDRHAQGFGRLLEQLLSRFTSRIVCSSAAEYDLLAAALRVPAHRIVLLHPALRADAFRTESNLRAAFGLPAAAKLVGLVGPLVPERGADIAMRALRSLRDTRPDAHLVIFGSGPEEPSLRALVRSLGLDGAVHWLGDQPARHHYHNLAAIVSPARRLDWAYAPLEALYCGVPVVATPAGAPYELFAAGVTGFFVPADDPAALSRQLGTVLGNDLIRARMAAAVRNFRTYLELDRMLDELEEIYFGRLSGRRPPPIGATDDGQRGIMTSGATVG